MTYFGKSSMSISGTTESAAEYSGVANKNRNSLACSGGRGQEWKAIRAQGGPSAAKRCSTTTTAVVMQCWTLRIAKHPPKQVGRSN